ncbi:MAG: 3'-5' exonuclease [Clostridiaceae bacterium]|nr:3'-5' exonuclease [Clostridiaceae bacterium]
MQFVVFDLEWNCAGRVNKIDPATQEAIPFEIIEIGAVKLDEHYQMIGKYSVCIRPRLYPILTGPVAAVTGRLQPSLKYGLEFTDAAQGFLQWCGSDYLFCTWSESDTAALKMNLKYYGLADQLQVNCLDIQYLFDVLVEQAETQRSIEYAVDFLNIAKNQPFHQAVNDAWYTGLILQQIAEIVRHEQSGLDFISRYAFDPNLNRSYQFSLSGLATIEAALAELRNRELTCPACGEPLLPVHDWNAEGKKIIAAFACPVHGRVTGKSRMHNKGPEQVIAQVSIRLDRDQEGHS